MNFTQAKQLEVWRTFSDGSRYKVGVLAQNRQGVFFQYQQDYLAQFSNLSPFKLSFDTPCKQGLKHHIMDYPVYLLIPCLTAGVYY